MLTLSGQITLSQETLVSLLREAMPASLGKTESAFAAQSVRSENELPRLAYSMRETAEILGVSYITVHRLVLRGLLRSSSACRHKIIPKTEIERFLRDTGKA